MCPVCELVVDAMTLSLRNGQQFLFFQESILLSIFQESIFLSHSKERLIPVSVTQSTPEMVYRAADGIYDGQG